MSSRVMEITKSLATFALLLLLTASLVGSQCSPNPCLNGGTCELDDEDNDYECECTFGYIGDTCEMQFNEGSLCSPNPCLNGGTCEVDNDDNEYECECTPGYIGDTCETPLSATSTASAVNGVATTVAVASGTATAETVTPRNIITNTLTSGTITSRSITTHTVTSDIIVTTPVSADNGATSRVVTPGTSSTNSDTPAIRTTNVIASNNVVSATASFPTTESGTTPSANPTQTGGSGGFGVGLTFVLKHSAEKCIAPTHGLDLVFTSKCDNVLALFTQLESGLLKNLRTGYCVGPGASINEWIIALKLSSNCEDIAWRVQMTSRNYLKIEYNDGACVHPRGGLTNPVENTQAVLYPSCGGGAKLVFTAEVQDVISNDLAYGALVGRNQARQEGYLIRIVDRSFHDPPVLVAWKHMNYSATWVNMSDIFIKSYQSRSVTAGIDYSCRPQYSLMSNYLAYVESTLKTGMTVRVLRNTAGLLKGDMCVNLGHDDLPVTSRRLWCYRPNKSFVIQDMTDLDIVGDTYFPGVYEFVDENGAIVGNYRRPVVRNASIIPYGNQIYGSLEQLILNVHCGEQFSIDVTYSKNATSSYVHLQNPTSVSSEQNFSVTPVIASLGYHFVEFKLYDTENNFHYVGQWFRVLEAVKLDVQVNGPSGPSTFIYSNTTLGFNFSVSAGDPALIGIFGSNITAKNHSLFNLSNSTNSLFSVHFQEAGLKKLFLVTCNELTFHHMQLIVPVGKVYPMKNLTISANSWTVQTGVSHTMDIKVSGGSDFLCDVSFGDGTYEKINHSFSNVIETSTNDVTLDLDLRNSDANLSKEFFKTFNNPGIYSFQVNCSNSLSDRKFVSLVTVQHPIVGLTLTSLPYLVFGQLLTVTWKMTQGTNVTVGIFYNDLLCCNSSVLSDSGDQCGCLVSDPGHYDVDGLVDIRALGTNLVSIATSIIQVVVLKRIENVTISMLTSYSQFGSGIEGQGSLRNKFPAEYPVMFNSSYLNGPAISAGWTFTCSISGVTTESDFFFDKIFPSDITQSCDVILVLKNNISTANASRTIELVQSIILTSMTNDGPVKANQTITLTISLETFGSGTCITVDMNDNSSLLVFGAASCETKFNVSEINPNIVTEPRLIFSIKTSSTKQIVIHHRYLQLGTYVVKMNASNDVSTVSEETVSVILDYECENPNVSITGLTPNASNILNAAQVYRSAPIALSTEKQLNCEKTQYTTTLWTVFQFHDDPRILNTIPNMYIQNLRKTPYHTDLSTPDLLLPGRDLPYGFYEVRAKVEMKGLPDVFGSNSIHIQVVQTPWIEAAVTSGSFFTVPFGNLGVLNASASTDPDFVGTSGMTFAWYCRNVDDDEFVLSNLTQEVLLTTPQANESFSPPPFNSSGCFGTGRGRLDETRAILKLDTRTMLEDKTYAITLVISKIHPEFGLRQDMSNIYFYVARGLPPQVQTSCLKNCQTKVNREEKIILTSKCTSFCYGKLEFSWSLYLYGDVNMPEPYNLTDLTEIPQDEFQNMASNPINELDLAIKSNSLQAGRKYTLAFQASRPNRVYGEQRYTMLVNDPPGNGNCSISPLFGQAMMTNFTFICEKWADSDSPLTFEFSYESKGSRTIFFHHTAASGESVGVTDWLSIGNELNDHKLNISILIKDYMGAKTMREYTLKVVPPSQKQMDVTILSDFAQADSSLIHQGLQAGDTRAAIGLASALASILNHIAANTSTNSSLTRGVEKKVLSKQIRLQTLKSLSNASVTDISSVLQMSGIIRTLTERTDELVPEAKDTALEICESLTDSLEKLSEEDAGYASVEEGVSNLVGSLGHVAATSTNDAEPSAENSTKSMPAAQVKRSINLIDKIQGLLLANLVPTEGPSNVETDQLSLQVEKVLVKNFGKQPNCLKSSKVQVPSAAAFGLGEVVTDPNNTFLQMQPIDIKMALFTNNPFSWDNTSQTVTSNVVDIVLESNMNITSSNLSEEIAITVGRDSSQFPSPEGFFLKPSETNNTANTKEYLKFHCFTRSSNWTSMNFELQPEQLGVRMTVYMKKGGKPDIKNGDFEFSFKLPDFNGCTVNNEDVFNSQPQFNQSENNVSEVLHIDPYKNCLKHPYTVFLSNTDFSGTGEYCFAVHNVGNITNTETHSRSRRSVSCDVGKRRVRRSCVIIPTPPPKPTDPPAIEILVADNLGFDGKFFFPNQTPNYNMTMFESSCVFWDVENETWAGQGCRVAVGTKKDQVLCYCNHLTSFGSDLLVAPNPIDFDSVFKNFGSVAENVAVLALISTILGLYIFGVIWARRADKRDLLMVGPTIISDPHGSYNYLITLYTGKRQQAGTTARVVFKLSGDQDETLPVRLWDPNRPCFERGQDNTFIISYPEGVGDLSYVQIWHDNSGSSPSWYLSRLSVKDLQTNKQWFFVCDNWLAVESEDGKVCRVLPVANNQELTNFQHLFTARTVKGLADGHIWFSIVSRPPSSNFTRVQRLSCALCLLCCTMITSAMFYNMGGQGPSPYAVNIGSLVIDLKQFVIGLQSSVIILPVNIALVQIFRNLRPRNNKKSGQHLVEEEEQETQKDKDKPPPPKGKLPHWFIYIAYALCYLASAASIFFTLLYSIQWGKETSTEWVIAMVTAFLQSALLLQPVKVVITAVIFALVIRKPCDTEEESTDVVVVEPTPNMEEKEKTLKKRRRKKTRKAKYYSPPDPAKLKQARAKRLKEIKMNEVLKEIAAFFIFLVLLMMVAHHHRDPDSFLLTKTLHETFEEVDAYSIDLGAVSDQDSLWMWARETLIPGLYAGDWYNGKKSKKGYIANMEDYLVGVPRVRLLRVEKDSCRVPNLFKDIIPHCYSGYSLQDEDVQSYDVSWKSPASGNSRKRRSIHGIKTEKEWFELVTMESQAEIAKQSVRGKRAVDPISSLSSGRNRRKKKRLLSSSNPKVYTINPNAVLPDGKILSCLERWRHQTMSELRGFPYWGTITMYSGSGYVANLGYDSVTAYTVVSDLHSNGWIDVQARAVFVEFTVYNANTNLFGIISIFIEFPPSASSFTRIQYQAARFYLHLDGGQTLAHVLVIFFMLYFFYRETKLVYKQRWTYFKGFWNWVEIILVLSEFMTIVLFLARLYEVDRNLLQLRENPNDYVGFQYAASADAALSYVLGVLVFFYILRFLRLLRFNKNFLVIGRTLSRISTPILSFCIPFFFGFIAFGLLAFSTFGSELEDYSSFMMTIVTQFSMTLGDFDFEALVMVNPLLGPLYFFAFVGLNVIVLMNVFLAIINDSFAEVQEENVEIQNEYEIMDYVTRKCLDGFYAKWRSSTVSPVKEKKQNKRKKKKRRNTIEYPLPASTELCCDELDSRSKRLHGLARVLEENLEQEAVVEKHYSAVRQHRKQDDLFRNFCLMESVLANDRVEKVSRDYGDQSDVVCN